MVYGLFQQQTDSTNTPYTTTVASVSVSVESVRPIDASPSNLSQCMKSGVSSPVQDEQTEDLSELIVYEQRKRDFVMSFLDKTHSNAKNNNRNDDIKQMILVDEDVDSDECREPTQEQELGRSQHGNQIVDRILLTNVGAAQTENSSTARVVLSNPTENTKSLSEHVGILDRLRKKNQLMKHNNSKAKLRKYHSEASTNTNTVVNTGSMNAAQNIFVTDNKKQHLPYYYFTTNQVKMIYYQFGSPGDVLQIEMEDGITSPEEPDHVVIQIEASSVSVQDCVIRRGFDFDIMNPVSVPVIPGCDAVGHIVSKGHKAYGFKEGDRVAALLPNGGGNARYISLPISALLRVPTRESLDAADVISMLSVFTPAYQMLKRIKQTGPTFTLEDKKVLIIMGQGRTDPIGHALIQMCHKARATIFVTAPFHKHHYYRTVLRVVPLPVQNWLPYVEHKMDYVFDGLCDDGLATPCLAIKKDIGEIICYGYTSMLTFSPSMGVFGAPILGYINKIRALNRSSKFPIQFYNLYESFIADPTTFTKNLKSLFQLLKLNKIRPSLCQRVALEEVPMAQQQLEEPYTNTTIEVLDSPLPFDTEEGGIVVCYPWKEPPPIQIQPCEKDINNTNESGINLLTQQIEQTDQTGADSIEPLAEGAIEEAGEGVMPEATMNNSTGVSPPDDTSASNCQWFPLCM